MKFSGYNTNYTFPSVSKSELTHIYDYRTPGALSLNRSHSVLGGAALMCLFHPELNVTALCVQPAAPLPAPTYVFLLCCFAPHTHTVRSHDRSPAHDPAKIPLFLVSVNPYGGISSNDEIA